jgi:DNA helicase-2/ATP-dependent DNA helicase PcrA
MDFLDKLNAQQRIAVTAGNGPVLVVAGPGSGKTRVLTQRIAYLIAVEGVRPWQILAVTFTNKAAREMEERVKRLLPGQASEGVMLGTFHSICARILRKEADYLPISSNFVIFDTDDQERIIKAVLRELNINEKLYRPASVHGAISRAKNELIGPEEYPTPTYRDEIVKRVYGEYQKRLVASNAVDFDDILMYTAHLLEEHPSVRDKYAQRFRHVLVDEFQDTNLAQYALVKHLASFHRNIFVVGDPDQCLPAGMQIQTPEGPRNIETLRAGDEIIAASGHGSTTAARVSRLGKRTFRGNLVEVTTRTGHVIRFTPNHMVFARIAYRPGAHYVCLTFQKDTGYHLGIVSPVHEKGGMHMQEHADKVWILKVCPDRHEAQYWESYYSTRYGIPTAAVRAGQYEMSLAQGHPGQAIPEIDTDTSANQLMTDLGMDLQYPHRLPPAACRNLVRLQYFGDHRRAKGSAWHAHRVDLSSDDPQLAEQLKAFGYHPRAAGHQNWRIALQRLHYESIQQVAQRLSEATGDSAITAGAFLVEQGRSPVSQPFDLMPASHLHPTMIVAIERGGQIIEDEIIEVRPEPYHGYVYDLEVDELHNYVAAGMVVHNSIYAWRGADWRNIQRFEQDFPDAQTILLEQNYRSRQNILDAAMGVIDRARNRKRKKLFSDRGEGEKIFFYEAPDDYAEASFVVDTIAQLVASRQFEPGDCAVMYRTNAQSRLIEEAFLQARLPYRLVGAQRFYGRREVKDIIAFLRLIHNPADEASLDRVINIPPRGIGDRTLLTLHNVARQNNTQPGLVLLDLARGSESPYWSAFAGRASISLADFGGMLASWRTAALSLTTAELFDRVVADIGYKEYISDDSEEG